MRLMNRSFKETLRILKEDKIVLFLSSIPVLIGIMLYGVMGGWLYNLIFGSGKDWILSKISSDTAGSIIYYFLVTLITIVLLIIVNYTFVLVVSLIACPFNDIISGRVEKILTDKPLDSLMSSVNNMFIKIMKTIINESKKIALIILLSLMGFILSFFPLLVPISLLISAILLSVTFVDYSWSRNDLTMRECIKDYNGMFLSYTVSGIVFLFILSIPIINLFCYPLGIIYYTVLYTKKKQMA